MPLAITTEVREGGVSLVRLRGSLDAVTAADLEAVLAPLANDATVRRLVLDGAELDYVSSAGLRVFLYVIKVMNPRHAKFYGAGFSEPVFSLLWMTGFLPLMETRVSVDECLKDA